MLDEKGSDKVKKKRNSHQRNITGKSRTIGLVSQSIHRERSQTQINRFTTDRPEEHVALERKRADWGSKKESETEKALDKEGGFRTIARSPTAVRE